MSIMRMRISEARGLAASGGRFSDRTDFLGVERELVQLDGAVQPFDPAHFSMPGTHHLIIRAIELNAVAAIVLGQIAGLVRGAQRVTDRRKAVRQRQHPDAGVGGEHLALPR